MTTQLKSFGISLSVHLTLLGALCVVPASVDKRFSATGQTQAISIQASQSVPVTLFPPVEIRHDPSEPESEPLDAPRPARLQSSPLREPSRPTDLTAATQPPPAPHDAPRYRRPSPPQEELPEVPDELRPPPRPPVRRPQPIVTTAPVKPPVGLENERPVEFTHNPPPQYPTGAVSKRLEGTVLLRMSISPQGDVDRVEVVRSSGHTVLDQAAIEAVRRWKGEPATRWGRPVASVEILPVRFRL